MNFIEDNPTKTPAPPTHSMTGLNEREVFSRRPRIGITIGDPAGIGPEVSLKAAIAAELLAVCTPILIGDARYLAHWAQVFGINFGSGLGSKGQRELMPVLNRGESIHSAPDTPVVYNLDNISGPIEMGREQAACGQAAGEYIETAVRLCQLGEIDAITTAPINKKSLHLAGYPFPGHTEFLAHLTQSDEFAMTFFSERLRVALLTTHVPFAEVPRYVKREPLEKLIRLIHREFERYGYEQPRIALAALNPHGGEGSLFGSEEAREMLPAIESCRDCDGINISGPHSGDTIFVRAARGEFDVVISCYHDQGLIPIKCMSFGEAVNVTLGLPFIRTSVDHGTAFDIAGQNKADHSSMVTAVKLAADLFQRQLQNRNGRS